MVGWSTRSVSEGVRPLLLYGGNPSRMVQSHQQIVRLAGGSERWVVWRQGFDKCRDGAKNHERTIYWAVFDQKRAFVEGGPGRGDKMVHADVVARLKRELTMNATVTSVLGILERREEPKTSKPLVFGGYPKSLNVPEEE